MEKLPKVNSTYLREKEGVLKVAFEINRLGFIFRETPNGDVGIDAQIELVDEEANATGKLIAIQIKSGDSYLNDHGDHFCFYPTAKHRSYWKSFPIPVVLFVYSPKNNQTYFADVRYQLMISDGNASISIPKTNILEKAGRDLFESSWNIGGEFYETAELLEIMIGAKCQNPTFSLSFFDLFVQGLTNISRQLFFCMSLAVEIAEFNNETDYGMGLGREEHQFLHEYVKFLFSQNIAAIDYADYLIDWNDRQIQPTFLATITPRGRQFMDCISAEQKKMGLPLEVSLLMERSLVMMPYGSGLLKFNEAKEFHRRFKK